jgi:hemerythrin-like domain-containing protein
VTGHDDQALALNERMTSRRALLGGVAALAAGAAGTKVESLSRPHSQRPAMAPPPDVDLMAEHGVLKRVLLVYQEALRRVGMGQAPPVTAIHNGAEIIHDFIESFHEALEEGYVFPRLRSAGKLVSTVDTLLVQHGRGRELTQLILQDCTWARMSSTATGDRVTSAMSAFVRMYEPHEAREDTVVFPAYRELLSAEELNQLASTFADLQARQFGAGAFSAVVDRVAATERSLGIYDLNQFTPAPTAS